MILIITDWSDVEREFDRLLGLPDLKMNALLDTAHGLAFAAAQAAIHIDTTSLKSSGKKKTEGKKTRWTGTMRWGGRSIGVNNPVDYAIYEKARDGDHDWLRAVIPFEKLYVGAIKKGLGR